MSEELSNSDIDSLLSAIKAGGLGVEAQAEPASAEPAIKVYDFKRPERFPAEMLDRLRAIHEDFARLAATSLYSATRAPASVRLASLDQLAYGEFVRAIPSPSVLAMVEMGPAPGQALLEIDQRLAFALVELLFGGKGESPAPGREITDIERSLLEGVFVSLLGCLASAWAGRAPLKPLLAEVLSDTRFARIAEPSEIVALASFEAKVGEAEGLMNLCLPAPLFSRGSALERALASAGAPGAALRGGAAITAERLGALELARYATFEAAGGGLPARELAAAAAGGRGLPFEGRGRFSYEAARIR